MKAIRLFSAFLILPSCVLLAQKKEVLEVQRDVALVQDQVRTLQRTVDEKMAALTILVQQALDTANKSNTSVAVLDNALRDRFKDQEKNVVAPMASVGSKVDQMSNDFQSVREALADLTARVSKMQNQIMDLSNTVKTMNAPPAPPPPAGGSSPAGAPPNGVSAQALYDNAMGDRSKGNYDIALAQFQDYLRYFPNTDLAPNAQYQIGELMLAKGDTDGALQAFNTVTEMPESNKTPDAMYMKAKVLTKMGQKLQAQEEYRALIKRYPNHELAAKAKAELKAAPAPSSSRRRR